MDGSVVYGVLPPVFGDPPLAAVTGALPDLADLGVDVLWLAPVFEAAPGDYGYAVTDYAHVRRAYGTDDDLRRLVSEAHRRGMRVLLDFVPNHTSSAHPYFADAESRGAASPYFRFYARDADGGPTHYFDWTGLPNLDYQNEAVRSWMIGATVRWTRDFHVDGFRMDAAWGVYQRAPDLWARWTSAIRRTAPDAVLVAEASARDPAYFADGFDAAYDWTEQVGAWAWHDMFDDPRRIPEVVWRDLRRDAGRTLRFLDNNDTGERFVTRHGPGMTRVAAAMLLTLPGVPCLFTGDERGAEYEPYAARGPVHESHPELRAWYRKLIRLRHAHPALARGEMLPVETSGATTVLSFVRRDRASGDAVLVVLNFDARPVRVSLRLPGDLARDAAFVDRLGKGGTWAAQGAEGRMDLDGWGVSVASLWRSR